MGNFGVNEVLNHEDGGNLSWEAGRHKPSEELHKEHAHYCFVCLLDNF